MRRNTIALTILLLLAACAPGGPDAAPPSPEPSAPIPSPADATDTTAEPPRFEDSLILGLWDDQTGIHQLTPVDPASGEPVPAHAGIQLGGSYTYAFSPDGGTLAVIAYQPDNPADPVLHEIDLATWTETLTQLDLTGWPAPPAFSPDGRYLAFSANYPGNNLLIIDLETDRVAAQISPGFDIASLKFNSDGSNLMAYGRLVINRFTAGEQAGGPARAALFDARDLAELWSVELTEVRDGIYPAGGSEAQASDLHRDPTSAEYFYPGLAYASGDDRLYVVHADQDRLTTVDFKARSVHSLDIRPKLTWFERFLIFFSGTARAKAANGASRSAVISPDGDTLYTAGERNVVTVTEAGNWEYEQIPFGLQAIDVHTGNERFKVETTDTGVRITPDGAWLVLQDWTNGPSTRVVDSQTGQIRGRYEDSILLPARRMNGAPVLVSAVSDGSNRTFMTAYTVEGRLLGEWQAAGYGEWLIKP